MITNSNPVKLGDFLDLVSENLEDRNIRIKLYTCQGSNVDYQGEFDSFYSYCLYPFYEFEIDSVDLNEEEYTTYLLIYLKFDIGKFTRMKWVEKDS